MDAIEVCDRCVRRKVHTSNVLQLCIPEVQNKRQSNEFLIREKGPRKLNFSNKLKGQRRGPGG
jgi:hypothetical protein